MNEPFVEQPLPLPLWRKIQTSLILATMLSGLQFVAGAADWRDWNNGQQIGSFCAVAGTAKETGIDGYIRYLDLSNLEFILF